MGEIQSVIKVKLVVGFIFHDPKVLEAVLENLKELYGEIDSRSDIINFSFTSYYAKEMGEELSKSFVSFKKLINPEDIADIKIKTNEIEQKFLYKDTLQRMINIDPGYLSAANLVLATTKNFSHRIYIGKGIYAEVTLLYRDKKFQDLEWTYPDFKSPVYKEYLMNVRSLYMKGGGF